jgi:transposase InsO family protein
MQPTGAIIDYKRSILTIGDKTYPFVNRNDSYVMDICDPIMDIVREFDDVFYRKGAPLKPCNLGPLEIKTGDAAPVHRRPYRTPLAKRKIVENEIREMLDLGVIRPSSSPWAAPLLLVPKKDQTWRCCVDYRALNEVTQMDRHPLPLIQDIFDQLGGATVFSTIDLKAGYWQLPVAEDSIPKTAFVCHMGQYEFTREPMGICCGPPVYQREMQRALAGLTGECVLVYLDDLVIYSNSIEEHAQHLRAVLSRLREHGLTLKKEKCAWAQEEVELLGYVISSQGIRAHPDKVHAIASLASPRTVREVRSLLGMAGYYRQTVKDFARITEPLVKLTRKHARFEWGDPQQRAFEAVKSALTSNEVMAYPQVNKPFKLFTDASQYAVGAVLVQEDNTGTDRVIHYVSHQLSSTQQKWAAIEREAYAVVYAVKKLHTYLHGATTTVYTDHKPLKCLFTKQMDNTKVQRWAIFLSEYGIKIDYVQGARNVKADMLSRISNPDEVCVIDTEQFIDADFPEGDEVERMPLSADGIAPQELRNEQRHAFPELFREAHTGETEYEIYDGLLYSTKPPNKLCAHYPRLVLPPRYYKQVIERAHRDVGHMGRVKTQLRVQEAYVWKGMKRDITKRLTLCALCAVHSRRREHVSMGEMPIAAYPGQIVSADLVGPLAETEKGEKYILTLMDHFSGWAEAYPLPNKQSETVTTCIRDVFFARIGEPEILITDNGAEFNEAEWREYLETVGIEHRTTTPVHPQSNGRSERFHRTMKEMLRKLINGRRTDWARKLPTVLKCYRIATSTVTGFSPFHLWYSRRPRIPLSRLLRYNDASPTLWGTRLEEMARVYKQARDMTAESRKFNRERLAQRATAGDIRVGDTVIVAANEPLSLTAKWDHQFEVIRRVGTTYWIRNQVTGKVIQVHREKIRLTDPDMVWDDVATRPRRQQRRRTAKQQAARQLWERALHPAVTPPPAPLHPAQPTVSDSPAAHEAPPPVNPQPMDTSVSHDRLPLIRRSARIKRKYTGQLCPPSTADIKRQRIECVELVRGWCA